MRAAKLGRAGRLWSWKQDGLTARCHHCARTLEMAWGDDIFGRIRHYAQAIPSADSQAIEAMTEGIICTIYRGKVWRLDHILFYCTWFARLYSRLIADRESFLSTEDHPERR